MIRLKTQDQIEKIRESGIISAQLFKHLEQYIHLGISTLELDAIAENFIRINGAIPSLKGYNDYPFTICTSINNEVVHGLPSEKKLKEGDIIGIDVGVEKDGFISDQAKTFAVGKISLQHEKLIERTELSLYKAIKKVAPYVTINSFVGEIEDYIKKFNYGSVKEYCGHGVGFANHEPPEISNYRSKYGKKKIKQGVVFTIEPMLTLGSEKIFMLEDGWTIATVDGKYSAHFEHTVAVTKNGYDILTLAPDESQEIISNFLE